MIGSSWTIQIANSAPKTFASLGLKNLRPSFNNAEIDTATFIADGAKFDSAFLWNYKDIVTIYKDGNPWFTGRLTKPRCKGNGTSESIAYEISNPWWDMEKITYQQIGWFSGQPQLTSMIALGYEGDQDGLNFGQITTGQQILRILNFALGGAANLQIGQIDNGLIMPTGEYRAEPCARLLRNILQWVIDGVMCWDYTTNPPTFNIPRRANARTVQYSIPGPPAESIDLTPRYDLLAPCVAIEYIQTNRTNGSSNVTHTWDIYPPLQGGQTIQQVTQQIGALVMALTLDGSQVRTQKQQVQATAIPNGGIQGGALAAWVQSKVPGLKPLTLANLAFGPAAPNEYSNVDPNQKDSNGNAINNFQGPGNNGGLQYLSNELTLGTIPPWLAAPKGTGQTVPGDGYKHLVMVTMRYQMTYNGVPGSVDEAVYFQKKFMDKFGNVQPCWEEFTIRATDIPAGDIQTYEKPVSVIYGEPIPQGWAQYFYEALNILHWEGTFPIAEQECSGTMRPGMLLNIVGGRPEWASAKMQIQKVTEDIDNGKTTVTVGPPKVFSAADLLALMQAMRKLNALGTSCPSTSREGRSKGSVDETNASSDGIGHTPSHQGGTGAGETAARDPWGILIQPHPTQLNVWQYGVTNCSTLFSDDSYTSLFTVKGLLTSSTPTPTDTKWITWNGGSSRVWLEVNVTGYGADVTPTYAEIQGDDISGSDYGDGEIEDDGGDGGSPPVYTQTIARIMIATIAAGACGQPVITPHIPNRGLAFRQKAMVSDSTGHQLLSVIYMVAR